MVATAALAFGIAGAATAAVTLTANIDAIDADAALAGVERPDEPTPTDPHAGTPMNLVLMGSDTRDGANGNFASSEGTGGARSDTTMVLHLSADRSRVELVSIPRDTTVDIPTCVTSSGSKTAPWRDTKFNAAFSQGYTTGGDIASGALCTLQTVEKLTGVRMTGFVVVDFAGFQTMIDALDGVDICIPEDISAPEAGNLTLAAGQQRLDGGTALQFARARKGEGLGDGSDISRIGRQQQLMSSLANTVLGKNLLTDAPALLQFLGATTSSLTMSQNVKDGLTGLAYSLRDVRPDTITFMTVPWGTDPNNAANVVWTDEAETVWENLRQDVPVTTPTDGATPAPSNSSAADPSDAAPTQAAAPAPAETKEAGKEAFTSADVTAVCG